MASPGVVHDKGQGMLCLATDVTQEHFVQACVDGTVLFAAAMLERGQCTRLFCVGQACPSNVFVADLELGAHKLNETHLVNKKDIGFLEDFNVSNDSPGSGGKAALEQDVLEDGIDVIECQKE